MTSRRTDTFGCQAVFSGTTQELFFSSVFPKSKCLCQSSARRGQPCIMSALTAMQLYLIQSLDKSKLKPLRNIHRVCL